MGMRLEMNNPAGSWARCQNCNWKGAAERCKGIEHCELRVAPGEPTPAGECPECGSLCQLIRVTPRPKVAASV